MKNHTELLNYLVKKNDLKTYVEIGVQSKEKNFDHIDCELKWGVDPDERAKVSFCMGSDKFFEILPTFNYKGFDLIFIDGLHHADQVKRDFENSLKYLNDGGFIILHDTLPDLEKYTSVPRETTMWYGDVYKFAMTLSRYDDIGFVTLNMDCGCTVIWKYEGKKRAPLLASKMDWKTYTEIGKVLLNVIDPDVFIQ